MASSSCFFLFVCIISISAITLPSLSTADSPSIPSATPTIPSSYKHHCSSIVPPSPPTQSITKHDFNSIPYLSTSYFTGGHQLLLRNNRSYTYYHGQKSLSLQLLPNCHETLSPGVFMVQAILHIQSPYYYHDPNNFTYRGTYSDHRHSQGSVSFSFTGFWSETSQKACMVGSAYPNFGDGRTLNISGVLKLKYVSEKSNASIHTSVISGTLASLSSMTDPGYFDPISMFSFPCLPHYNYSLPLSEEISNFGTSGVVISPSLSLDTTLFCSELSSRRSTFLDMEYTGNCPGNSVLPRYLSLIPIQCSSDEKKIRYVARFVEDRYSMGEESFSIESTLIAEGVWDNETNQLFVGACRMLNPMDHFDDPLAECGIRLSLRYPSVLTIRNDSTVVGEVWCNESSKDEGYFGKIKLTSNGDEIPGQKHEYTEMTRVLKSCPVESAAEEGKTYPDEKSRDLKFDAYVQNSTGERLGWAYATPVFVEEELYRSSVLALKNISEVKSGAKLPILTMSYKISISPNWWSSSSNKTTSSLNMSLSSRGQVEISAEGVYNVETGQLCMIGCRKLRNQAENSKDCEILVKFQFPPLDNEDHINGTIVSTRQEEDPLHFEDLTLSAAAFYTEEAEKSVWRMDLRIAMCLVSSTLYCIFIAFQIFHVKKNPQAASSISLMMVLVMVLPIMIGFLGNIFEAVSSETHKMQTMLAGSGGRLEANELASGVIALVALLLLIHLLQLVWTAKQSEGLNKSWSSEKKASLVTLFLYILGALFTVLFNWTKKSQNDLVCDYLRCYTCLIWTGFLLPQIILNAVRGSTEKALSKPFFMGLSATLLLPHVYIQYYRLQYDYGDNAGELHSAVWDAVVPLGVVSMAVVVFMQQSRS